MSRTYVITGANSGIGKVTTETLRAQGHTVIGVDLRGVEISGDLSTPTGRAAAVAEASARAGDSVDGVIACAGLALPRAVTAAVNYFGMTAFLEGMQPALARSAAPRVALISSIASVQPVAPPLVDALLSNSEADALEIAAQLEQDPQSASLIYSSSTQAISRWVRRAAPSPRWAGAGIPVNAVGPGTVITPMTQDLLSTPEGRALTDAAVPMPLHSHQSPQSVADLLIWLTSAENTHVTGQTIYCDGGADAVLRGDDVWSWNEEAIRASFTEIMSTLEH